MSFVAAKILWLVVNPGNLYFFVLCLGVGLLWTRWRRAGRRLILATLIAGAALAVLPVGKWMIIPLESRFPIVREPPDRVDGIIVLGGAVNQFLTRARGQPALNANAERLLAFAELAARRPRARLVYSGGSGDLMRQDVKEAETARLVLAQLGVDLGRVTFEDRSRNTYENAVLSRELVAPRAGETWLLVTSARHMPRAVGVFRRAGWPVTPFPVDFTTDGDYGFAPTFNFAGGLGALGGALKEWLGLVAYYAAGRSDALFPGPGAAR